MLTVVFVPKFMESPKYYNKLQHCGLVDPKTKTEKSERFLSPLNFLIEAWNYKLRLDFESKDIISYFISFFLFTFYSVVVMVMNVVKTSHF